MPAKNATRAAKPAKTTKQSVAVEETLAAVEEILLSDDEDDDE